MTARIFTWDCRQQPDMDAIAALVAELSGGKVIMQEVDTQSDEYAWTVSGRTLSDDERQAMLDEHFGG